MILEQNIRGLCSKNGIDFLEFMNDLEIEHVNELTIYDLEAICEEYNVSIEAMLFKPMQIDSHLNKKIKNIKFLILDVDGVMTDGGMYFTADGDELKKFNTKDGMGIMKAIKNGLHIGIISSGFSDKIVKKRSEMLGIHKCYVGRDSKLNILNQWMNEEGYSYEEVAMIGDDINDLEILQKIGVSACPSDAVKEIKSASQVILNNQGGKGCIREFIDNYLSHSFKEQE